MAYVLPTLDDFQDRFPEFTEPTDEQVEEAIRMAARRVDTTWLEEDYQDGILYLAAHLLSVMTAAAGAVGQDDEIKALTIGPLSLTFGDKVSLINMSSTIYGQTFVGLARRNRFPIVAVSSL